MCNDSKRHRCHTQRGATLIEVVLFIVILSVALGAILNLMAHVAGRSGDPVVLRQSIAVAESLLEEIMAQPYTTQDLDGVSDAIGPETGETRDSATTPFDHVNDYHGLTLTGISMPDGTAISGLEKYNASVTVQSAALDNIASSDGLLVHVTVTGPDAIPVTLSGYRAKVSP